jgi:hypothetical protein
VGSLGDLNQGLQAPRVHEDHLRQVNHQHLAVPQIDEPGGHRGAQPIDCQQINLPGHRHHQRRTGGVGHAGGLDPQQLLIRRTQHATEIGIGAANP